MCAVDPRERDLVKCEDMRTHAVRAQQLKVTAEVSEEPSPARRLAPSPTGRGFGFAESSNK